MSTFVLYTGDRKSCVAPKSSLVFSSPNSIADRECQPYFPTLLNVRGVGPVYRKNLTSARHVEGA